MPFLHRHEHGQGRSGGVAYVMAHNGCREFFFEKERKRIVDMKYLLRALRVKSLKKFRRWYKNTLREKLRNRKDSGFDPNGPREKLIDTMLLYIAESLIPDRPFRREPRALKRRPKPCQLLTSPGHILMGIQRIKKHKKIPYLSAIRIRPRYAPKARKGE